MTIGRSQPVVALDDKQRIEVLLRLIQINRQEIREWQQALFTASLWFNGAIVALAAFVLRSDTRPRPEIVLLISLGIVCLGAFYFVFSGVARSAVELSGTDLLKLQVALRLHESDHYLAGEPIYDQTGTWLPQSHVVWLRLLNLAVCLLAVLSLVL